MKFGLISFSAFLLCLSGASDAAASGNLSPTMVADSFVDALKHQRFNEAAAMFAPESTQNAVATERSLKRIGERLGGFSMMHSVARLPEGKSVAFELPTHNHHRFKMQQFVQVRYAATTTDGQAVFYQVNLATDNTTPKVLSFALHIPVTDAESVKRAYQRVSDINQRI